jgi:hypothetical protein
MIRARLIPSLLVALGLCGCTLIDQRTFERTPQAPGADAAAQARLPAQPLLTIPFGTGDDWGPALQEAVEAAQGRKPDVQFEVATTVPMGARPAEQARLLRQGAADAEEVANGLASLGVPPDHVHISVQGDHGAPAREVRVYVK